MKTRSTPAWWVEPVRYGEFRLGHPFLELPNVIGSPHNSATLPRSLANALVSATDNIRRVLQGQAPLRIVADDERFGSG